MIFVLSAIRRPAMVEVVRRVTQCLAAGGRIVFRDYAKYDMAQLRFANDRKIDDKTYVRADSTLTFFFEREELVEIFEEANLKADTCTYVQKRIVNRKKELTMDRVWIQAEF